MDFAGGTGAGQNPFATFPGRAALNFFNER
jgi:hypothetical protein